MKIFASLIVVLVLHSGVVFHETGVDSSVCSHNRFINRADYLMRGENLENLKKSLDTWFFVHSRPGIIPSAAVSAVYGDEIIYKNSTGGGYGRSYRVASITKTFIALSVLQLHERGLVDIDQPVSRYLNVKLENELLETDPITVRHILTHTSGIPGGGPDQKEPIDPPLYIPEQTCPAGYRFTYSNPGYNLLARLLERISGLTAGEYITFNILQPLEMNESEAPDDLRGASGLTSSVDDLSKYVMMLIGRGTYKGRKIISESVFNEIFRETLNIPGSGRKEYRGIAWRVWKIGGRPFSINHASLWDGSGGWIQVFPDLKTGFVFMSDPPEFDTKEFFAFYRGLKGRLLQLTSILKKEDDFDPVNFLAEMPGRQELMKLTGIYRNNINKKEIFVEYHPDGYLQIRKQESGELYRLVAFSMNTFVYIFPGQFEKGVSYDFVWGKSGLLGLATSGGFYKRLGESVKTHL